MDLRIRNTIASKTALIRSGSQQEERMHVPSWCARPRDNQTTRMVCLQSMDVAAPVRHLISNENHHSLGPTLLLQKDRALTITVWLVWLCGSCTSFTGDSVLKPRDKLLHTATEASRCSSGACNHHDHLGHHVARRRRQQQLCHMQL